MESPGVIWIPTGVASSNLAYLVHHETAHQWFYGIVGGDQAREPFTDEAVTDFLARYVLGSRRSSRCDTARLDRSIYQYGSTCYYEVVYIQGGNYLNGLRTKMGSTAFWQGLRTWIADHRYGIASTRSLLETLDAETPLDLRDSFARRFPRIY
jgi:aminopeptidase N